MVTTIVISILLIRLDLFERNFTQIIKSQENLTARGFTTMGDLLQSYKASLVAPTQEQLSKLSRCVNLMKNTALIDLRSVEIILVGNHVEAGLPFTVENKIILPLNSLAKSDEKLAATIFHETIHLLQRYNRSLCEDLYTNYWGFVPIEITLPTFARNNPDLDDTYYSWNGNVIFTTIQNKSIKKLHYYYYDKHMKLHKGSPKDYRSYFKDIFNIEHPNEIMAELLTKILFGKRKIDTVASRSLMDWYNKHVSQETTT